MRIGACLTVAAFAVATLFAASAPLAVREQRAVYAVERRHQTEVTVIMDGNHASFTMDKDKESVLDAGLRAGIDLRYSCKGGVCSTCRCKVLEGQVEMDVNYALEDYEVARGFTLRTLSRSFQSHDAFSLTG